MTAALKSSFVNSSRSRFVTFGSALILAACLTLVKITLVALDLNDRSDLPWHDAEALQASVQKPPLPGALDDRQFVPWPMSLPEPAAGPAGQDEEPAMPFGDPAPMVNRNPVFDPSTLTDGQVQALQELETRRRQLDERERLLDVRAELNGRTGERLDQQIGRLAEFKTRIEALLDQLDDTEEQKLARLVKIYETMKPKSAAEIFNRLEIPVLLHVVERMKEAKSAVVLGKMDPAIARRVTSELARRKDRPLLDDQDFGS